MPTSQASFSLRKIAVPAFGPSLLYGMGQGAILPVIALSARELGASIPVSGLIAALVGIGSLVNNIPASLLASRYGERRAMMGAAVFSMIALALCALATHVWLLALGVTMVGMASSVFLLARQAYLTDAVPVSMRARAMSTLGGTTRIGMFAGPFAGAAAIHLLGLSGAYWVALFAMMGAGIIAYAFPEMSSRTHPGTRAASATGLQPGMSDILRAHRKVFVTLGVGVLLISAMRASRQVVIPLWADHLGLEAATISLVYGLVAAVDMAVFYPAGRIMDLYGRLWIALPSTLLMGISLMTIPFTTVPIAFVLVSLVLGFGNGIGSGIVMTLAADASPENGRTKFLGIWRLMSDLGGSGGPALLAAVTAMVSLAAGITVIGTLGLVAAAIFSRFLPARPTR